MLRVIVPGPLATIQDGGRPDRADLGVPIGGAADRYSLAIANLLHGNEPTAPALEVTLGGLVLEAGADVTVALAGADLAARTTRRPIEPGTAVLVAAGQRITFEGPVGDGLRAYLSLAGGVLAPIVLGSASTLARAGIGGLAGAGGRLAVGDLLRPTRPGDRSRAGVSWLGAAAPTVSRPGSDAPERVRILPGPHPGPGGAWLRALAGREWLVSSDSDRMGVRLDGRPIVGVGSTSRPSFPVTWGAVQVPSSGLPIVLSCEHQTMGGYPVPAVVIRADLDRLGQLRPGDRIRFETVSEASARAALTARDETLRWARRILLERDEWDDLAGLAGS